MTLRKFRLIIMLLALAAVVLPSVAVASGGNPDPKVRPWKGAESFAPVVLGPNPAYCDGRLPPEAVFGVFEGSGVDTEGLFNAKVTGCLNLKTNELFNLYAVDTFVGGKDVTGKTDSVNVVPDDFTLQVDSAKCVATNAHPVAFTVEGGTGRFEGATGQGTFHFAMNYPPDCNALVHPAQVWFEGHLRTPA